VVDADCKEAHDGMLGELGQITAEMWTDDFVIEAMRPNDAAVLEMFEDPAY
jgi:hypothetical protein